MTEGVIIDCARLEDQKNGKSEDDWWHDLYVMLPVFFDLTLSASNINKTISFKPLETRPLAPTSDHYTTTPDMYLLREEIYFYIYIYILVRMFFP